jgi:hypothetical protein
MTIPPRWLYGDPAVILEASQYQANVTTKADSPPLQGDRWSRNGLHPDAGLVNALHEGVNQSVAYRTKSIFDTFGLLNDAPFTSSTNEARFYSAFHTGPYHHALYGMFAILPAWDAAPGTYRNAAARVDIYSDAAMSSLVTSETFTYGQFEGAIAGFDQIKLIKRYIAGLTADTDYYMKISAVDNARIFGASVADLQSMTDGYSGWLPQNLTTHSSIADKYRADQIEIMNKLWRRGGSKVLNWNAFVSTSPRANASSTPHNLIDNTTTTITADTPGYVLDMTGKARLSQTTGVPCVMKALGNILIAGSHALDLKDSAGATVASIGFNATLQWQSVSFNLPATVDKYDLHFYADGVAPLNIYAVSIYEHET